MLSSASGSDRYTLAGVEPGVLFGEIDRFLASLPPGLV